MLIDLGCGMGGPGQWIARESGAHLVGIDLSQAAVEAATTAATPAICSRGSSITDARRSPPRASRTAAQTG
ncbi:class I SAM-dependent methyltransferase [Nakamurella sp. UYEF19]|uniref:class I SAM-dependent methyltransferase n=1 Tax=Nakamurella sp. UYEF19 TaxID=1756392 RepID=UPI00339ABE3F